MNLFARPEPLPPCRPYQLAALQRGREALAAGAQAVLLCLPTGTGKTRTAVEACVSHVKMGGRAMFVAPRRELVSQASKALEAAGLVPEQSSFVRTIQELSTPHAAIPPVSLVVLDEARHYVADAWSELRKKLPEAVYLGLDATPERGDGRGLGGMFDVLVEAITVRDAIAGGWLVPCEVLRPERALAPRELAQDPVNAYLDKAPGSSAVAFCHSVDAARELAGRFSERGAKALAVWGEMPSAERDTALERFASGEVKVLTNMHLLTEGWDAPITETIILARGFPTAGGLLQACGRGLRPSPGKARCLLLDLPGSTHVHGEPDEPRTWHLEGKAARRANDSTDVRFCPVCGAIVTPPLGCEQCGYAGEMKKRKPRVLGLPIDRFARERAQSDEQQIKALAGYLRAARAKGYREGWAFKCWTHKYGRTVTDGLKRAARALV